MKISNITVNGEFFSEPDGTDFSFENLILEQSIKVGQTTRGDSKKLDVRIQSDQIIELVYDDGTTWITGPDNLDDIYPEQLLAVNRDKTDSFEIPVELTRDDMERGIVDKVLLKVINIFTKKAVKHEVKKLAAKFEDKELGGKTGLFRMSTEIELLPFKPKETNEPFVLFIHGTASSIEGSFGKVKNSELMAFLEDTYKDRILAFQHRTLTENPLQNVLELVKELPKSCSLHLVTSSRGGLVGEVLSRFCNSNLNSGFSDAELFILERDYPADYYQQIVSQIDEIRKILQNKKIRIEKFIRVACPAQGTTLASKRTDIFMNVLMNIIGLSAGIAAAPAYVAFKNLVAAVIDSKNDVTVLPGLEVQNPSSPFIKAINTIPDANDLGETVVIDNSLIVISGNAKPAAKLSALLVIASKIFYKGKNDLVVDTDSMALGTRRTGIVQQLFYEADDINHFKYFENRTTNSEIVRALKSAWGEKLPGFSQHYLALPVEMERNALLKLDGGKIYTDEVSGIKPIVVLLPGIMGSNLAENGSLVWINYIRFITGGLAKLKGDNISATSLVSTSYKKLVEYLSTDYDVVTFPFDWRLTLEESAKKLNDKLKVLLTKNQPIKLIGHSMGGVLIRDFILRYRNETWAELNKLNGFQVIFLGSPLNGSFRIPSVLFGKDAIIQKLDTIDRVHSEKKLISIFSGFRGLLGLLPFNTDAHNDFSKRETWLNMAHGMGVAIDPADKNKQPAWPIPSEDDLNWFKEYRDFNLQNIRDEDFDKAVYIAGHDHATPCDYRINEKSSGKELVFLCTGEGDQSVTWESGIPKTMIEKGRVYFVNVSHGSLACDSDMFKGISDILENGFTGLFSKNKPVVRGSEKLFIAPQNRDFDLSQHGIEDTLMGRKPKTVMVGSESPIRVSVSKGDLFYSSYPVLAGHFENDGILSAEKAVDRALNGVLNRQLQLGVYPGKIGTCEVYITKQTSFKGAIMVGLGKPGELTASELTKTVEQGVAYYLLRNVNCSLLTEEEEKSQDKIGISALVIGSGYGGLPVNTSIKAIIQGVSNANTKIKNLKMPNPKVIEHIEFVEKFNDLAITALFSLSKISAEEANPFKIVMEGKGIKTLLGSAERIPMESSEGWWNRITVQGKENNENTGVEYLSFSVSTNSSREESQELATTPALIESIIREMSTENSWTTQKAKTIFELLIPNGFKEHLKKHGDIKWMLDKYSAEFPWELLQDNAEDAKPLCVSAGMIRQLKTEDFRTSINVVPKNTVLVVADPNLNGFASQLPGALQEGKMVNEVLAGYGMDVTKSLNDNHPEIIEKMFSNDYRIIHLSGHGVFNPDEINRSGMVIGNELFLTTREINQMSAVPELVFVNCCHLGKTQGVSEKLYRDRYKLASNIGTQLIENGVKCVIAAGWAVNDEAALEFARVFYNRMFDGYNFGESVKEARNFVYRRFGHSNTWGAYQCYGDPFYTFDHLKRNLNPRKKERKFLIAQQAEIALTNLLYEVEIGTNSTEDYLDELKGISKAVKEADIRNAAITEGEGKIYFELRQYDLACEKFSSLLKSENASFSFSVAEKYCNSRAKKIVNDFGKDPEREKNQSYVEEMAKVISDLETLNELSPTSERLNILASTYKRQGILLSSKRDAAGKKLAYVEAAKYYKRGFDNYNNWYSLTNWLTIESMLVLQGVHSWSAKAEESSYLLPSKEEALRLLEKCRSEQIQNTAKMSYWDMLAGINIRFCTYFVQVSDAGAITSLDTIFGEIKELWKIAGSKGKRFAEIEHLEFIADELTIEKKLAKPVQEKRVQLNKEIEKLINELNKLV